MDVPDRLVNKEIKCETEHEREDEGAELAANDHPMAQVKTVSVARCVIPKRHDLKADVGHVRKFEQDSPAIEMD